MWFLLPFTVGTGEKLTLFQGPFSCSLEHLPSLLPSRNLHAVFFPDSVVYSMPGHLHPLPSLVHGKKTQHLFAKALTSFLSPLGWVASKTARVPIRQPLLTFLALSGYNKMTPANLLPLKSCRQEIATNFLVGWKLTFLGIKNSFAFISTSSMIRTWISSSRNIQSRNSMSSSLLVGRPRF